VDVVIFCGSICYTPNAYHYLKSAIDTKAPYIIFDRTPITTGNLDRFAVQHVPSNIYKATLPFHIFSYNRLMECFKHTHNLLEEWSCNLQVDTKKKHEKFMGFIFERNFD
jgi:putative methyltransferase (TIGR04325 family)